MLPDEIESIIHAYRREFERVDNEISDAISTFYAVESRTKELISQVKVMKLSAYHVNNLKAILQDLMCECAKLVSEILVSETITPTKKYMLQSLVDQTEHHQVFHILLHPYPYTVPHF